MEHLSGSRKIYAAGAVILGILLMIWPVSALRMASYAAGIIVMAGGITAILEYFRNHVHTVLGKANLIFGIIVTLAGAWIFLHPDDFASVIPTALGYLIVISGLIRLLETFSLSRARYRSWGSSLLVSIVSIFMGVALINNAFGVAATMVRLGGLFVLITGISDFWVSRRVDKYVNRREDGGGKKTSSAGGHHETSDPDIIDAEDYREF